MAQSIASIDASLKVIADYVQLLHIEKTGEKTWEVQRYVVGTDGEGNPCVWLYATHPGIEFAVTRIYHERLADLPLAIPANVKVWDGEVAPSAEAAAKKGYFNVAPAPFTISLMPTGKKTDAGLDIRRFSRVISVGEPTRNPASNGNQPPAAPASGNGNGKQPPRPAQQPPEPPPWEEFEDEFERMPPAAQEPAQAAALARAKAAEEERAAKAAYEARQAAKPKPIDHEILASILQLDKIKGASGFTGPATPEQWGLLKGLLEKAMGDKTDRNAVLARLAGVEVKTVENPDWRAPKARAAAIIDWLVAKQPNGEAIRPLTVAEGRGVDLATVMQGAWGALAAEHASTEDVPY
jgi:hypothetical protein